MRSRNWLHLGCDHHAAHLFLVGRFRGSGHVLGSDETGGEGANQQEVLPPHGAFRVPVGDTLPLLPVVRRFMCASKRRGPLSGLKFHGFFWGGAVEISSAVEGGRSSSTSLSWEVAEGEDRGEFWVARPNSRHSRSRRPVGPGLAG